ncbi:hypothetical protein ACEWY4_017383 [Coilia grayii]|uniref:Immunoglobulin V-set domain-containing protein n=1 Tax=Coilia grayii TaxID=363190 RepID=A0ABD1JGZ2_9TELE
MGVFILFSLCVITVHASREMLHIEVGAQQGNAAMRCDYPSAPSNLTACFYKHRTAEPLVCSTGDYSVTQNQTGRFLLTDDRGQERRVIMLTIVRLQRRDSGVYWCGSQLKTNPESHQTPVKKFQLYVTAPGVVPITSYEGARAEMRCPYTSPADRDKPKYLCRGLCPTFGKDPDRRNVLVRTEKPGQLWASKARYSLRDDPAAGAFVVGLSELRMADMGLYCCGVNRGRHEPHVQTEQMLVVLQSDMQLSSPVTTTVLVVGVTVGVCGPLLLLLVVSLAVISHSRQDRQRLKVSSHSSAQAARSSVPMKKQHSTQGYVQYNVDMTSLRGSQHSANGQSASADDLTHDSEL